MPPRLKSLELNGYKTFASRISFEFADNITAVVGPNGSGKSNIADAVRWVLGEQSYRLLRGRKTDDMIFAGSETRPKSGMASATIVFDNSDGWLPIDFSEVSIARRAYRDGQNEYLINNQKVRLRDVTELLSKSGLAERTYTVIGQGLVDVALSLKADERRRLFEEAAGVGLYRDRREQALRRLETTQRNLERAQDILAELKPRLRSLERQAQRAEQYVQIKTDLQEVLREWYGYHWHNTQRDLKQAREVAQVQEKNLEATRRKLDGLTDKLVKLRAGIREQRTQLNEWEEGLERLRAKREETSRELAVSDERKRSLIERKRSLASEGERLGAELILRQSRLGEEAAEVERLQAEVTEAQTQALNAQNALQERRAQREAVEQAKGATEHKINQLNAQQVELIARQAELEARVERHQTTSQAMTQDLEKVKVVLHASEEKLTRAKQEVAEAEAARTHLEKELKGVQAELVNVEQQHKEVLQTQAARQAAIARAEAELDVFEQAEDALIGYESGARLLLQAAQTGRLAGTQGSLNNFLEVPDELATAITAALGEYIDAILLAADSDPEQALTLLEREPARAALLPMGMLNSRKSPSVPIDDGCLGIAADLVKVSADIRPAIDMLLGQVLVVRDRAAARRMLAGQEAYTRVVTLRGEVFHNSGAILVEAKGDVELLNRPRKRRRLVEALDSARAELKQVDNQLKQIERHQNQLKEKKAELDEALMQAKDKEERKQYTLHQVLLEAEQARREYEWQNQQYARIEDELQFSQVEIRQIAEELAHITVEVTRAKEELESQGAALADLPIDDHQTQVTYWETQAAVWQRAVEEVRIRHAERQRAVDEVQAEKENLQARLQALETQSEELETGIKDMHDDESGIGEEAARLQALVDKTKMAVQTAEQEQDHLQEHEVRARQGLSVAERHHTQAQIALVRKQEALDTLRERIEDDFGLVEFEYDESISGPTPLPFDGMVERLPVVAELSPEIEQMLKRKRTQLRRLGSINPEAQKEYREVKGRYEFMSDQVNDLQVAEKDVREVIAELDALMEREFRKTFDVVANEFRIIFSRLFGGGFAKLVLTDPEDLTNTGIDIEARLPGKRTQRLSMLSGGERSLTAAALVFALLKASPTPFCVMDEVDAMLDEANISRFIDLLSELSENTQFVLITHNRGTVQAAGVIYGITMGRDTASQMISLKLEDVDERYAI